MPIAEGTSESQPHHARRHLFWYRKRYHRFMPSLNITFTDEELTLLREAAEKEGVSLKTFAHRAVVEAASSRKKMRDQLLEDIFAKSAELNERLA